MDFTGRVGIEWGQ